MMEILLSLTASFSVMERRLSTLISGVSSIKEKQDNLQYSLYCLQPRKSDGEHRRGFLPSPELPSWLRQRKSFSSSTSSMPVKRKPSAAWHVTDSFTEQFSLPFHGRSLAQPSFKLAYSNTQPSDHLFTPLQPRTILGKSALPLSWPTQAIHSHNLLIICSLLYNQERYLVNQQCLRRREW